MTRKIKAQDVKPGMEIKWTAGGWKHSGTIARVRTLESASLFVAFWTTEDVCQTTELDQEVTVLKEAQPDEPTAFGSRATVDGRRLVRAGADFYPWVDEGQWDWWTWDDLCRMGPVSVIPDQGWTVPAGSEATEPRVWDRWEDVPDMVAVRSRLTAYDFRRNGDRAERLFRDGWAGSILTAADLNAIVPFTEVRDA